MIERVRELVAALAEVTEGFDPALVHADDAETLVGLFTRIERLGASGRTLAARRAAETHTWKRGGFRSPEEWLAQATGSTQGQAHRTLKLGEQLQRHDDTRREYTAGNLSEAKATIVAGTADENPAAEAGLLATARQESVTALRREAARAKAAVADEEARQARIHQERYVSAGPDEDGAYRGSLRMSAFQGGIFDTIWRRFRDRVAGDARKRSEHLTAGQIGADALVLMAQTAIENLDGDGPACGGPALPEVRLNLLVDHEAWERGHAEPGETCEIDGIGPVTVAQARCLAGQDAFVTAGTTDGADVFRMAHLGTCSPAALTREKVRESIRSHGVDVQRIERDGRHVPAVLDTTLTIRDRICRHPGCDRRWGLQRDHLRPVELGGLTSYRNLQRLCWHHHQEKTRHDMARIRAAKQERRARAGPARAAHPP